MITSIVRVIGIPVRLAVVLVFGSLFLLFALLLAMFAPGSAKHIPGYILGHWRWVLNGSQTERNDIE